MGDGLGRVPPDVGGRSSEDGERDSEDGAVDDNDTRPRHKTSRHVYDASSALNLQLSQATPLRDPGPRPLGACERVRRTLKPWYQRPEAEAPASNMVQLAMWDFV